MTDDLSTLFTAEQMAARYGRSRRWVMDKARTSWPHITSGRSVLFTAEQVAVIDRMQSVTPEPAKHDPSWGRRTSRPPIHPSPRPWWR